MALTREEVFALPFNNDRLKVVAAGHEKPLENVGVVAKDEYGRSVEFLLDRHDVCLLARALGITDAVMFEQAIKG